MPLVNLGMPINGKRRKCGVHGGSEQFTDVPSPSSSNDPNTRLLLDTVKNESIKNIRIQTVPSDCFSMTQISAAELADHH
jgi:hypothetical protein